MVRPTVGFRCDAWAPRNRRSGARCRLDSDLESTWEADLLPDSWRPALVACRLRPRSRPRIPPRCVRLQDRAGLCRICSSLFPTCPPRKQALSILLVHDLILNRMPTMLSLRDVERLDHWTMAGESNY